MLALDIPERYLRLILDTIPDGICVEMDGRIVYANAGFARLHGYMLVDDVLGRSLGSFIAPQDAERVSLYTERRRTGEPAPTHYQFKALRRDGTTVDVEVFVTSFRVEGRFYVLGALRDIGERTQAARRSEQDRHLEALGRLASGVAHDLDDLFTTIGRDAALVEEACQAGRSPAHALGRIQEALSDGVRLADKMQAFSGDMPVGERVSDPIGALRGTRERMQQGLAPSIRVELSHPSQVSQVAIGGGALEQILMNLAQNAADAMPGGGVVTLCCRPEHLREGLPAQISPGRFVRFQVQDTGEGMDSVLRSHIFEPFFTTKAGARGSGLGLSVVYGILRAHGGWADVQSEPGRGTRFIFWLPVVQAPPDIATQAEQARAHVRRRILVVEDEGDLRALLQEALEVRGYDVRVAANAADGLSELRAWNHHSGPVDLACVDLIMPGMDGVACAAEMRRLQPDLRIILCAGPDGGDPLERAPRGLLQGVVRKPIAMGELLAFIRERLKEQGDAP